MYEDELDRLAKELGGKAKAQKLVRADRGLIRFYIPEDHLWAEVRSNSNALGNTMTAPQFKDDDGKLRRFDKIAANPMWNQKFGAEIYEKDPFGHFERGTPPSSSADWGWVQHMAAQLKPGGKMAVVLDTGAVSRGSGNEGSNKERDVRRAFVDADRVECVILLPENLFYNTSAPGIILVMRRGEPAVRPRPHAGEILLINASKMCAKGRPKNYVTDELGRNSKLKNSARSLCKRCSSLCCMN